MKREVFFSIEDDSSEESSSDSCLDDGSISIEEREIHRGLLAILPNDRKE